MIPIADLQIGNRVLYNGMEAIVYSIRGPYPDVSERFNNKPTVDLILGGLINATEDELEPIVLTEEIILKCGFEKQMTWTFRIHLDGNNYLVYYLGEKGWSINNKKYSEFTCKYFHELQQLYSILTKKELEIKS